MLFRGTNLPSVDQPGSFLVIKGVVKAVIRPLDMQIGIVGDDSRIYNTVLILLCLGIKNAGQENLSGKGEYEIVIGCFHVDACASTLPAV